jgi:hypothetical protein
MVKVVELRRKSPLFQRSFETSKLAETLAKARAGDMLTYAALSQIVGRRVDGSTGALHSARRVALREYGLVFDAVPGVGLRCLTSAEIVNASDRSRVTLGRRAKAAREKLNQSNFGDLDDRTRVKYATHQSIFGAISMITSHRAVTKIGNAMNSSAREMPIKETLALFQKTSSNK